MTTIAKLTLLLFPAAAMLGVGVYLVNQPTAGDKAAREYQIIVDAGARPALRCAAANDVADAYLRDENAAEYTDWHMRAEAECATAQLEG